MPAQRALITWRNGEESMVVQSGMHGSKGTYAWIVPVPSKPSKIDSSPTYSMDLDRLRYKFHVLPLLDRTVAEPALGLGILLLACGLYGVIRPDRRRVLPIIVALFSGTVLFALIFPVFAGVERGAMGARVSTLESADVGPYHVDVVKSSDPGAMFSWLKERDGSIGPVAEKNPNRSP
jgi:hypothetical protein